MPIPPMKHKLVLQFSDVTEDGQQVKSDLISEGASRADVATVTQALLSAITSGSKSSGIPASVLLSIMIDSVALVYGPEVSSVDLSGSPEEPQAPAEEVVTHIRSKWYRSHGGDVPLCSGLGRIKARAEVGLPEYKFTSPDLATCPECLRLHIADGN